MKDQFQSTEALKVRLPAFVSSTTGAYITDGSDVCTVTVRKPDGSTATYNNVSTPAVTWDSTVKMWSLDIPTGSYIQGEWKVYATSNGTGALAKWAVYTWGDYVNYIAAVDLSTLTTSVAAVNTKLGTPAGASVSADVASNLTAINAVNTKLGSPAGASVSADIASARTDIASARTDVASARTEIAEVKSDSESLLTNLANVSNDLEALADLPEVLADLQDAAFGNWKIQGTQLILYRVDDSDTPWKVFDLYDDSGLSSGVRVFERRSTP